MVQVIERQVLAWLRLKLNRARKRLQKESRKFEQTRQRRAYWLGVVQALENRINNIEKGQLELDL